MSHLNHRRINKPDTHHHPWVHRSHCYGGGHQGAALGRKYRKTRRTRDERRKNADSLKTLDIDF